jgi:hypothetical protein
MSRAAFSRVVIDFSRIGEGQAGYRVTRIEEGSLAMADGGWRRLIWIGYWKWKGIGNREELKI